MRVVRGDLMGDETGKTAVQYHRHGTIKILPWSKALSPEHRPKGFDP
jgi:hypothetical protein